ncbi:MAG TPA: hypothetical protein VFV01_33335, partial [Spirillospora sp.]|nr:hypothetical protein [Spirillospora sp.]
MTPKGTPDDEHDGDRQDQAGPGRAPAPPPPGWLGQGTPPQGAHLLPEPAEQPPPFGEPLPEPQDDESDRTVSDIDISGTMRTQVFSPGDQAAGGAAAPAPLPAFPGAPG